MTIKYIDTPEGEYEIEVQRDPDGFHWWFARNPKGKEIGNDIAVQDFIAFEEAEKAVQNHVRSSRSLT
jgi:hypothetical protein